MMTNSVINLGIVLADILSAAPPIAAEVPEIGLFRQGNSGWTLSYSTDKLVGEYRLPPPNDNITNPIAQIIKSAQGFLTLDGIGALTEAGDFKYGGGRVLQSAVKFKLNNTAALRQIVEEKGFNFYGRVVYVTEIVNASAAGSEVKVVPLFCGKINQLSWGETILEFTAVPNFHQERSTNLQINGLPVTFGANRTAMAIRSKKPKAVTNAELGLDVEDEFLDDTRIELEGVYNVSGVLLFMSKNVSNKSGHELYEYLRDVYGMLPNYMADYSDVYLLLDMTAKASVHYSASENIFFPIARGRDRGLSDLGGDLPLTREGDDFILKVNNLFGENGYRKGTNAFRLRNASRYKKVDTMDAPSYHQNKYGQYIGQNATKRFSVNELTGFDLYPVGGLDFTRPPAPIIGLLFSNIGQESDYRQYGDIDGDITLKAQVLFQKHINVEDRVYIPANGRIFASTWDNRRNAKAIVTSPLDVMEHALRLSKITDEDVLWGQRYFGESVIDIAAFDDTTLNDVRLQEVSRQNAENKGTVDTIVRSICAQYYLVSKNSVPLPDFAEPYRRPLESVISLENPPNGAPLITISQILSEVTIREPQANDIYCEPVVKYGYVEGVGYRYEMAVTQINMPSWKPEYTRGLTDDDAKALWDYCKGIYNKYRIFGEMPTALQELEWVGDYGEEWSFTGKSYHIALDCLYKRLRWMQCARTQIKVAWEIGHTWGVGTHIMLSLKHLNNGEMVPCVIEKITKTRYGSQPNVSCDLILLNGISLGATLRNRHIDLETAPMTHEELEGTTHLHIETEGV